jgi:hypothetical protein
LVREASTKEKRTRARGRQLFFALARSGLTSLAISEEGERRISAISVEDRMLCRSVFAVAGTEAAELWKEWFRNSVELEIL